MGRQRSLGKPCHLAQREPAWTKHQQAHKRGTIPHGAPSTPPLFLSASTASDPPASARFGSPNFALGTPPMAKRTAGAGAVGLISRGYFVEQPPSPRAVEGCSHPAAPEGWRSVCCCPTFPKRMGGETGGRAGLKYACGVGRFRRNKAGCEMQQSAARQ